MKKKRGPQSPESRRKLSETQRGNTNGKGNAVYWASFEGQRKRQEMAERARANGQEDRSGGDREPR
jgi:hypothetical protein